MSIGRQRRPFLGALDSAQNANVLLRDGLAQAAATRVALRDALLRMRLKRQPLNSNGSGDPSTVNSSTIGGANGAADDLKDVSSKVDFDAKSGLTTLRARAKLRRPFEELAAILDPRAWGAGGEPVAASLPVKDDRGNYTRSDALDCTPLGRSWDTSHLLYEYARSSVASFENILKITSFTASRDEIRANYHLHDCLECTFGAFSAPGGLMVNEGFVRAIPSSEPQWWVIQVKKEIQIRDLTPHDPGNPYDFGEWVNSTIGAALSQWIHGTAIISPVV
jgi:hypothetical protein